MENNVVKSKAETFIGFAIRAGKYRLGMNAVETLKKAKLIIVCSSASLNTVEQAKKSARKFNCPILLTQTKNLSEMVFKENSKVMAVTDASLARAILDNSEKDFIKVI